jgi:hypothetical protein
MCDDRAVPFAVEVLQVAVAKMRRDDKNKRFQPILHGPVGESLREALLIRSSGRFKMTLIPPPLFPP